jgi:hypothetical protein
MKKAEWTDKHTKQPISLEFPALLFEGRTPGFWILWDWNKLGRMSARAIRRGWVNGSIVIDSNGLRVTISQARAPIRKSLRACLELLLDLPVRAELVLEDATSQCSLDELKQLIAARFAQDLDFWEECMDWDTFPARVKNAQSFRELIELFAD